MVIKEKLKSILKEAWKNKIENPIANKTIELENSAIQQANWAWNKYSPTQYYWNKEPFYRGLILTAVGLLVILWLISG